jgi:hypothetical protein
MSSGVNFGSKASQASIEFQAQIQLQRPGSFSKASKKGSDW